MLFRRREPSEAKPDAGQMQAEKADIVAASFDLPEEPRRIKKHDIDRYLALQDDEATYQQMIRMLGSLRNESPSASAGDLVDEVLAYVFVEGDQQMKRRLLIFLKAGGLAALVGGVVVVVTVLGRNPRVGSRVAESTRRGREIFLSRAAGGR